MTKKHFIALADVIRACEPVDDALYSGKRGYAYQDGKMDQWHAMQSAIADFCHAQNPRFDRIRWLDYIAGKCRPNGGKIKQAGKKGGAS